ncbi:M protein repeat protein-like protein [Clohesyomyces aquaticus]|uniref:M protein repeat protein-like protein n=1 Tax=Clohesyomyces aquaticus TaxID=1231657 RepID=A0A1Y1ZSG0_9PLEO|nr:M protein repeat protein-like protein [Clohesyomyces aquaticus]
MADEDKEKAEKVAAAKKRYEQLKKQKARKAGGAKKKEDSKPEAAEAESSTAAPEKPEEKTEDLAPEPIEATSASPGPIEDDDEPAELPKTRPEHGRKPSVAVESRLRSASFYQGGAGNTPTSPTAITPGGDVSGDIYRKQAQRIEELERQNKKLTGEVSEAEKRWMKGEEELEELREGREDVALAVERGREADKLRSEVESLKRQVSHLQTQTSKSSRRVSTSSPSQSASIDDLNAQVASKSSTIESLELEISNLHKQLTENTRKTSALQTQISTLESSLQKAEHEASSTKTELSDLKANLERASERAVKEGSSRSSAETRIAQLEAELGAANRKASDSISRAELLEKKVETLTQLHRDNDTRNQSRIQEHKKVEREAAELRTRVTGLSNENARLREAEQRRRKANVDSIDDSAGVQELIEEERERLMVKVRELEEENFELRRGVWRDRRRDMQPSIEDHASPSQPYASPGFDEVDLSGGHHRSPSRGTAPHSTLQDVINSGISAFTGQSHRRSDARSPPGKGAAGRDRLPSLGSLDDFEFDEEAFRAAQEEEGRKRIERVREVKRGLKDWAGWRGDYVDVRAGWGGVFEV